MELELAGKVAIVTGGSKGIGRGAALGFVKEGAAVVVCARGREALEETVGAVGASGRERIAAVAADLTDPAAIQTVIDRPPLREISKLWDWILCWYPISALPSWRKYCGEL